MLNKIVIAWISCALLFANTAGAQNNALKSPDGSIVLQFKTGYSINEPLSYGLSYHNQSVLDSGTIRLDGNSQQLHVQHIVRRQMRHRWQTVYGERNSIPDNYQQARIYFRSKEDSSLHLSVVLRVYNEGFAYQYILQQNKEIVLNNESSVFDFPGHATAWVSATAQGVLKEQPIEAIKDIVERPLTIRLNDSVYLALGEAALVDFARMKFTANASGNLVTKLETPTRADKELTSPWRYVLIANSPAKLLQQNYLLLNLNEPNRIADTKWIQPGKVLREVTLTTAGARNSIDFAAAHHISYILFDAGWYGREDHDTSDASRVALDPLRSKGPLNLREVISYGKTKGVGVILYVNRRALERQLDSLLPIYTSWGVKGLKFGFVQVGSQQWTSWLHEAIRKCAKYHLMVDVHDEYRPTGYSRTYPNLMTQEGIRGDEESPNTEHTITTLFTRMIAGAADNTICFFTNRVDKMGSHGAQMAKAVCLYSPWQFLFWYDHPKADTVSPAKDGEILEVPELNWFNKLPTTWDDTKILEGDMQAFATIARRKGTDWFIGSLNGVKARQVQLSLDFLDKNKKYTATIYLHDEQLHTATHIRIETMNVDATSNLKLPVGSRDGIAVYLAPKN